MPWVKDAPSLGFGPTEHTWLPQPEVYGDYAVDQQDGVAGSTLELYRLLLGTPRARPGHRRPRFVDGFGEDVVAFENTGSGGADTLVVANLGAEPVALPQGALVLAASGPLDGEGRVPTDTTVWATR